MNAFLKKEIRLLLPSWLAVLALAVCVPWFSGKDPDVTFVGAPVFLFFGVTLLAVDSFGREFSLGTFSSLMAQPIERRRIWRTKFFILFSAALLIFTAYFISSEMVFHRALRISVWAANPKIFTADFHYGMIGAAAAVLIALAGGLWTTLLIRQIAAAFWITFLTPLGILMLLVFIMSHFFNALSDAVNFGILYGIAALYVVAGFWFARKMFFRAQDATWTGGVISFSQWRYFEAGSNAVDAARARKPVRALIKKEFQLHSLSLFCAGALLAMHIAAIIYRMFHGRPIDLVMAAVTEFFWTFWFIMPLIIGCMAVAEERKLGVMNSQFCQPVSRRLQFALKFFPTIFFGVLFGGIMPIFLEVLAAGLGAPSDFVKPESHPGGNLLTGLESFLLGVVLLSGAFAFIGFWASTLAKNFMHALSISIVSIVIGFFVLRFFTNPSALGLDVYGFFAVYVHLCGPVWPPWLALLAFILFIPWLAWRNFNHFTEAGKVWRRNVLGFITGFVFIFVGSALLYNRVWEWFEPLEPNHGIAQISLSHPPVIKSNGNDRNSFFIQFPDGRVWVDNLNHPYSWAGESRWRWAWLGLVRPLPKSVGPRQFLPGSNWVSVAPAPFIDFSQDRRRMTGYFDTLGVQKDGSLWISSEVKPGEWTAAKMVRFGDETNWRQVVGASWQRYLLLKTDGTLWQWQPLGTNDFSWRSWQTNWPTVRNSPMQQIGHDSKWQEIFSTIIPFARKTDGSVWAVTFSNPTNKDEFLRWTNLDGIVSSTFSDGNSGESGYARTAYIGTNGILWARNIYLDMTGVDERTNPLRPNAYLQVGKETNWVAVAMNWNQMVALKSDGSLWKWKLTGQTMAAAIQIPPTRLSRHRDWVGVASIWDGVISLSADGSLWFWQGDGYSGSLFRPTRKPEWLANVFDGTN